MEQLHPRVARTYRRLSAALISLAWERDYENLTIVAVTQRANVGHATFYRHFKSLDALMIYTVKSKLNELLEKALAQKTHYEEALVLYTYMREHQDFFRVFIALPPDHEARSFPADAMYRVISERYQERERSPVPLDLSATHMLEAMYNLILWYLDNLATYTPEQVAAMHVDLIVRATESSTLAPREGSQAQPLTPQSSD